MKDAALIMAGGRSTRMRAGGSPSHKSLRTVGGLPLVEWNLRALLSFGFHDLFIAVHADEHALACWLEGRGKGLAAAGGASLQVLVEAQPLGTIGAAALLPPRVDAVVVVNVDNLSLLDLRALLEFHRRERPAATVAMHEQPFPVPLGMLEVEGGRVRAYREKPRISVPISSGTYVLGRAARRRIRPGRAIDVPHLVEKLLGEGEVVAAFAHQSLWVDVNDENSLARARELFAPVPTERSLP